MIDIDIAAFVLAAVGSVLSLGVLLSLTAMRANSVFGKTLFYLQASQLIDILAALPHIYDHNSTLCSAVGFINVYMSLANVFCGLAITIYLSSFIHPTRIGDMMRDNKYNLLEWLVFGLPCVALLPFANQSYGVYQVADNYSWCAFKSNDVAAEIWSMVMMFAIVWFVIMCMLAYYVKITLMMLSKTIDQEMLSQFFRFHGIYAFIEIIAWTPRVMQHVANSVSDLNSPFKRLYNYPIFVCGILFAVVFYADFQELKRFENWGNEVGKYRSNHSTWISSLQSLFRSATSDTTNPMTKDIEIETRISSMKFDSNAANSTDNNLA